MTATDLQRLKAMHSPAERFDWVWRQATHSEIIGGSLAYSRYNQLLTAIAMRTGHTLQQACGVFSALSPNNDYLGNVQDAATMLEAEARGRSISSFIVRTYGANKRKAWSIATGEHHPLTVIVAPKTRSFFHNLLDPSSPEHVTVDGHMANIWAGERRPLATRDKSKRLVNVSDSRYHEIAKDVKRFAADRGLLPCRVQAVLWVTWRRLHGIKDDRQLRFWDLDVEKAKLGFYRLPNQGQTRGSTPSTRVT